MTTTEKITELTNAWYRYNSLRYHKDSDCHFTITAQWSYGLSATFVVEHQSYLSKSFKKNYKDFESAQVALLNMIKDLFHKEMRWATKERDRDIDANRAYDFISSLSL